MTKVEKKQAKEIVVSGATLTQKSYPVLFKWAQRNPDTLAERLENMAKTFESNTQSVAQSLESDLEHGQ